MSGRDPREGGLPPERGGQPYGNPTRQARESLLVTKTVLIVDDHPSFRASARRMLEADGYYVVGELDNGDGVVAAVEQLNPEVVLLDVHLPDIDGFEVTRRLLDGND